MNTDPIKLATGIAHAIGTIEGLLIQDTLWEGGGSRARARLTELLHRLAQTLGMQTIIDDVQNRFPVKEQK